MKQSFKPLALAAAVAALSAGTTGVVNAQSVGGIGAYPSLGDAAIVPYYTVRDNWVTGVHIINTSDRTQVIKFRLRGAKDSIDVLDFNLVLSPFDEWTATVRGDETAMQVVTTDNSCTVPAFLGDTELYAPVPASTLKEGQEGYIEVVAMAAPIDENQLIAVAAKHKDGVPADCNAVRNNFLVSSGAVNSPGYLSYNLTRQQADITTPSFIDGRNSYTDSDSVLKVSYFIRDAAAGTEFGNNAVHLNELNQVAMMSHQRYGVEAYSVNSTNALRGWDFPNLNGGNYDNGANNQYNNVVRPALGADNVINDWSYNSATGAATDWVVTFPGQYIMVDYWAKLAGPQGLTPYAYDYREQPFNAEFSVWDREEADAVPGGLNFSPSPAPDTAVLPNEVNVIEWGPDTVLPVLESTYTVRSNPAEAGIDSPVGWASLAVEGTQKFATSIAATVPVPFAACDLAAGPVNGATGSCTSVSGNAPMVGFVAWQRTFDDPDKNYGRSIEHSFTINN